MIPIIKCLKCIHLKEKGKCDTFPNGIPDRILSGKIEHIKPYPGDNGIQFELDKKSENLF